MTPERLGHLREWANSNQEKFLVDAEEFRELIRMAAYGVVPGRDFLAVLSAGRDIWGHSKLSIEQIVVRLSVNVGKLARLARGASKDQLPEDEKRRALELAMGHIIASTIRWADDLGLDVVQSVAEALRAQQLFAERNEAV